MEKATEVDIEDGDAPAVFGTEDFWDLIEDGDAGDEKVEDFWERRW